MNDAQFITGLMGFVAGLLLSIAIANFRIVNIDAIHNAEIKSYCSELDPGYLTKPASSLNKLERRCYKFDDKD